MAHTVQTQQLAAYLDRRKITFAGVQVTLKRLAQMWNLRIDLAQPTVHADVLGRVAQYLRMTVPDLIAAVEATPVPVAPPAPAPALKPASVAPKAPAPAPPAPAPAPASVPAPPAPPTPTAPPTPPAPTAAPVVAAPSAETSVIPKAQLEDLVAASKAPLTATTSEEEPDIDVSFDDVEATPPPDAMGAADAKPDAKGKSRRGKGNKKR